MTVALDTAPSDHAPTTDPLEAEARALAETQLELERVTRRLGRALQPSAITIALEHARTHLAATHAGDATLPKAAEWFLDNYYLIRRVARQVDEELPRGFVRRLPQLASGSSEGRLRIEVLAEELVRRSHIDLDVSTVRRFIDAYQEVSPLTIAELWALPTMLRASVLSHLLRFLDRLVIPIREGVSEPRVDVLALDPGTGVERSTRALRLLDTTDWKTFFEQTNRVEAVLRGDPATIYPRMDFETCDAYRKVVEALAWGTDRTEQAVAELAIALAQENQADERLGHVGYYLVDGGRPALEQRLGYRARGIERVRSAVMRRPTLAYLLPVALATSIPLLVLAWYLGRDGARPLAIAVAVLVAVVPVSVVAVTVVQRALALLIPPRTLAKLDFSKGIPREARTLVVIPTLLGRSEDVDDLIRQIELHYLANPDPQLGFALLTDDVDAEAMPETRTLLERAETEVAALNAKHGSAGSGPFHLLHREPRWNEAEQRFMGWERKRGKLDELNRLLRGDTNTTFARHVGNPAELVGIRFVITLDSDTQLPMGTAHRLVGLLAHPLNRALVDPQTERVVAGYTIVQPRVETSPSKSGRTRFLRIFAGDVGFDIYTHAVSETYQDLFGSGIYIGKGIYDVDAFMRSVEQRAPENALVSHDLFEGVHGRTALATDIVLFEEYPASYVAYAKRMHRWVRGDWQLLRWLLPFVPAAGGGRLRNKLSGIDRWKIVDNLRRSLTSPLLLALLVLGWTWLPAGALFWTACVLAILVAPLLPSLAHRRRWIPSLARCGLAIVFLAFEAVVAIDAIVRVIVRTAITRKHLLQWTSAAHTTLGLGAKSPRISCWRTMWASPVIAVVTAALVAWVSMAALAVAAPLLLLWFIAPEVARWVSRPERARTESLGADDRQKLRLLARRTWRFFDVFVGPNDQWLPIDNYQAEPHEQTAHRTSPTNIGMMMLATLSAYDLGYLGPSELSLRLRRAFDTIERLAHYQGHLLNWYETKNLQPLLPRYVSTVDSGNFAGCLLALAQGCKEVAAAPIVRTVAWDGLADSLALLEEVVDSAPNGAVVSSLRSVLVRMQHATRHGRDNPREIYATLRTLSDDLAVELDRTLLEFIGTGAHRHETHLLQAIRTAIEAIHQLLQRMRRELESLLPWLALGDEPAAHAIELPTEVRLDELAIVAERLRAELEAWGRERHDRGELSAELDASVHRVTDALRGAGLHADALRGELLALAALAEQEVR
ncbi:MAG TPA: hypothetical protein VLB44_11910, partial [Kofleriaceae bacterium]|nr:hypothetical protein [Kofleriaceae bacterium]